MYLIKLYLQIILNPLAQQKLTSPLFREDSSLPLSEILAKKSPEGNALPGCIWFPQDPAYFSSFPQIKD